MARPLVVAQVGCGYWGPNLLRVFSSIPGARMKWLCDLKPGRLAWAQQRYPRLKLTDDYQTLLDDQEVDAIVIATEVYTHHRLAKAALMAGKHVFIEKPLAYSTREALDLARLAKKKRRTLGVGHVFLYNPAIQELRRELGGKPLGKLLYLDMVRINPGPPAPRHDVAWDMAPHDVALAIYLGGRALSVRATGKRWLNPRLNEAASIEIEHPGKIYSRIHVSWLSSRKIRRVEAYAEKGSAFFDDMEPVDKLRVVLAGKDTRVKAKAGSSKALYYAEGKTKIPKLPRVEPLKAECLDFLSCVKTGNKPLSGAEIGVDVVRALEAAGKSAAAGGKRIKL